jgi:hypothetical protein
LLSTKRIIRRSLQQGSKFSTALPLLAWNIPEKKCDEKGQSRNDQNPIASSIGFNALGLAIIKRTDHDPTCAAKRRVGEDRMIKRLALCATAAVLTVQPAHAQEKTGVRSGFTLSPGSQKRILVFRPAIKVGAQSTGGMFEPNGDWTAEARKNIEAALIKQQSSLGNTVTSAPVVYGAEAQTVEEYTNLFAAVSQSVINYQFFKGNRLPTKKRDNKEDIFEWSLGEGVGDLPGAKDADYALFIYNKDAYGSTGRKLLQVVAILGPGLAVKSGEHAGYAGLVDLRTGDLLWLNADGAMGGDVRTPEGAEKRVRQLLEEFPGSTPVTSAMAP